jgi:hypothetical protein
LSISQLSGLGFQQSAFSNKEEAIKNPDQRGPRLVRALSKEFGVQDVFYQIVQDLGRGKLRVDRAILRSENAPQYVHSPQNPPISQRIKTPLPNSTARNASR